MDVQVREVESGDYAHQVQVSRRCDLIKAVTDVHDSSRACSSSLEKNGVKRGGGGGGGNDDDSIGCGSSGSS